LLAPEQFIVAYRDLSVEQDFHPKGGKRTYFDKYLHTKTEWGPSELHQMNKMAVMHLENNCLVW